MCNFIILFLLFCNGGCGHCNGIERIGCNRGCAESNCENRHCGCSHRGESVIQPRNNSDCGCEERRDSSAPPPWVKSNYNNGDTCGCEEQ